MIPAKFHTSLVRQWWLFTLAVYIAQSRPDIDLDKINEYDVKSRDWRYVEHAALTSSHSLDAHFVKVLRAMKVASETWNDESLFYLKAALKFADEFGGWGGFGANDAQHP